MKLTLVFCLSLITFHANCQIGTLLDVEFANFARANQPVHDYVNIGLGIKPYLSPRLNLFAVASYRRIEFQLKDYVEGTDFSTYCLDQNSNPKSVPNIAFNYATLTLGAEFKLSPIVRIRYKLENNVLLFGKASDGDYEGYEHDDYIQYGRKAFNKNMITSNAAILIRLSDSGYGLSLSTTFKPNPLKDNMEYTYNFMDSLSNHYKKSLILSIGIWLEYPWKGRKRGIL